MSEELLVLLAICRKNNLDADELLMEADCVEEYGEYLFLPLIGFPADLIRQAAAALKQA